MFRLGILTLALACVLVLASGLGTIGLVDVREARDAQVAREMIAARDVLTPTIGHEPLFEKPVLAYAPEAAVRLFSKTPDLASRRVRACGALLLILLTVSIGAGHFGMRAGLWSGIVLATTLGMPLAARTDGTQVLAALLGWLGCAGFADAMFGRRAGRSLRLLVAHGAIAATALGSGVLPALWPLAGAGFYLALRGSPAGWRRLQPLAGLALVAALMLPWYGVMTQRHGAAFVAHAPFFPYAAEMPGAWFFGLLMVPSFLVIGFFPWSTLLPGAILHAATWWRASRRSEAVAAASDGERPRSDPFGRERREERAAHFFVACLIAALVPIALYPSAPLPAALPALPAAALLCGRWLDHLFEDPQRVAAALGRATLMLAIVGTVAAIMLTLVSGRLRDVAEAFRVLAPTLLVTSWAPFLANVLGRRRLAAVLMTLPVALGTPVVAYRLLPAMEPYLNTRAVAEAMADAAPARAPLALIEPAPASLRLYARCPLVEVESPADALGRFRATDGLAYIAFRPSQERRVASSSGATLEIVLRTPSMVLARMHPG